MSAPRTRGRKATRKPMKDAAAPPDAGTTTPDPQPTAKKAPAYTYESDPSAPEQDIMLGDKTPAYVSWLFERYPDEAKRRYTGRKLITEAGLAVEL